MNKKAFVVSGLLLSALALAACDTGAVPEGGETTTTGDTITIGWLGPLTGDAAALGEDALKASQLAVKEINDAGGIDGKKIKLIVEDGKCNSKDAANAGNKLINSDKVSVIAGGLCSGETSAVAPIAEENKVVVISNCSSAPTITNAGDYIFRTYPSDAFQGKFAADYLFNKMEKKKVAVLAVLGDWGTGIKNSFEKNYKELGGEVVFSEDYVQDTRDLRSQLAKIKSSQAEVVYFVGYTEASVAGLKQAKEVGLELPFFGGDAWDDAKIHQNDFAENIMFSVPSTDVSDEWAAKLRAEGGEPTTCAPRAYDNIKLIADVIGKVGNDATKIKDELYKTKDYPGVNGPISFDENGDVTLAVYSVKKVVKGKAEVVE